MQTRNITVYIILNYIDVELIWNNGNVYKKLPLDMILTSNVPLNNNTSGVTGPLQLAIRLSSQPCGV